MFRDFGCIMETTLFSVLCWEAGMARLSLSLLGPLRISIDGRLVTGLKSDKVRALLVYLAAERNRPHRRESLAALLWPEWPDAAAASHLRDALSNLRRNLGDRASGQPFILVTRDTLRFNPVADFALDVADFLGLTDPANAPVSATRAHGGPDECMAAWVERCKAALDLYRGPFLEGFAIKDSAPFEEWVLLERERIAERMRYALRSLSAYYERQGSHELALAYTRRGLGQEPWDEDAQRRLMRLLVISGQRGAALTQYAAFRRLLQEELGAEPATETRELYEALRQGAAGHGEARRSEDVPAAGPALAAPPFVDRHAELAQLEQALSRALTGHGQVVFVVGEAGSGKTALLQEFGRRAMAAHPDLVAVGGSCNAYAGGGDPYLPFREALELLTGDVEPGRAGGAIPPAHAQRLWAAFPDAIRAVMDHGCRLIGLLIPEAELEARIQGFARAPQRGLAHGARLLHAASDAGAPASPVQPLDLYAQVTRVLAACAARHPLVLLLDNLHWADSGTASLLFHLGHHLAAARILVVGAYRPEEVGPGPGNAHATSASGQPYTIATVVNELQREFGAPYIDLDDAAGRGFLEAFLDAEPNCLDARFRDALYGCTDGHALFTVELLRGMQTRGDLVRDAAGRWTASPSLQWDRLPARVEAVIAERIRRLPAVWQPLLAAAAVEGEEFTAEAVARACHIGETEVIRWLSGPLAKQHNLVAAQSIRRLPGRPAQADQRLSSYRFRHFLFQRYLYQQLDEVERVQLHEAVGNALEALLGEQAAQHAVQLAWHFERAGLADKAVGYLLEAGTRAARLAAYREAAAAFQQGLALLAALPKSPTRARREWQFRLALANVLVGAAGWAAPERATALAPAGALSGQAGGAKATLLTLTVQAEIHRSRGEMMRAQAIGEQMRGLAATMQDRQGELLTHYTVGSTAFFSGDLTAARQELEETLRLFRADEDRVLSDVLVSHIDVVARAWLTATLWLAGYPEQARSIAEAAIRLAKELAQPMGLAIVEAMLAATRVLGRDATGVAEAADLLMRLGEERGWELFSIFAQVYHGWLMARQGQATAGLAQMQAGIAAWRSAGILPGLPMLAASLIPVCLEAGRRAEGLAVADEMLQLCKQLPAAMCEAELHRLRGELMPEEAEACYRQAIENALRHGTRMWELRASVSLARLWHAAGRIDEARDLLGAVYGRFAEGFDTPDLIEARTLLNELAGPAQDLGAD
jgi:DNA-binding SARP family transcriptional activator